MRRSKQYAGTPHCSPPCQPCDSGYPEYPRKLGTADPLLRRAAICLSNHSVCECSTPSRHQQLKGARHIGSTAHCSSAPAIIAKRILEDPSAARPPNHHRLLVPGPGWLLGLLLWSHFRGHDIPGTSKGLLACRFDPSTEQSFHAHQEHGYMLTLSA